MQAPELSATVIDYINEIKENYEQQIKELQNKFEKKINEAREYQYKYLEIQERYNLLIFKRFVRSAEQLKADQSQPQLFTEEELKPEISEEKQTVQFIEVKSFKRGKKGRKAIPENIRRVERIIDIPESEKICKCGSTLTKIGEETSEEIVYIPAQMYVDKKVRPKYACRSCEGTEDEGKPAVRIAPVEPSIIPRSIVSPSLLSCIITQKYQDHLPFYRQERQFQSIGVKISRQDMSNWQQKAYKAVEPIFELLKKTLKSGPVMQMDETPVQVMGEEGRKDTQKSWMWLARGGPKNKKVILYEYYQTRAAKNAKELLDGYCGYLQTDGYESYDCAVKDMPGIIHVGCFAHARRKFFEASQVSEQAQTAKEGLEYIRSLYHIENKARADKEQDKQTDEQFLQNRKELANPVLEAFKQWLLSNENKLPPTLLLGKAIRYSLGQWDKLIRYLESPELTPDNNACENAIRPFVIGRKNWLFNQSPDGAESSCGMYSLIETAKQNGLVPLHYLNVLFEKAPYASSPEDWEKLLPWNIFTA